MTVLIAMGCLWLHQHIGSNRHFMTKAPSKGTSFRRLAQPCHAATRQIQGGLDATEFSKTIPVLLFNREILRRGVNLQNYLAGVAGGAYKFT